MTLLWLMLCLAGGYALFNFSKMGDQTASAYEKALKQIGFNIALSSGRMLTVLRVSMLWGATLMVIVGLLGLANAIPVDMPAHNFLTSTVGTILLFGVPTTFIRLKSGGKRSWSESYRFGCLYIMRAFGLIFLFAAVLMSLFTVADIVGPNRFNTNHYVLLLALAFAIVGYFVQHFAALALKRDKENHVSR